MPMQKLIDGFETSDIFTLWSANWSLVDRYGLERSVGVLTLTRGINFRYIFQHLNHERQYEKKCQMTTSDFYLLIN